MPLSESLHHECSIDQLQKIRDGGLHAGSEERVDEVCIEDGDYLLPETVETSDAREYAHSLVTTVLEEHRPDRFPQRDPSVWAFGNWSGESQMIRQGLVVLDAEPIAESYSLTAADFSVAETLYLETMREFEFRHAISQSRITSLCEQYWKSATDLTEISNPPYEETEIYISADKIPTEYITSYQMLTENGDYTPISQTSLATAEPTEDKSKCAGER